jgi:hypothetical protein
MNRYAGLVRMGARRCRISLTIHLHSPVITCFLGLPVITCFLGLEFKNIKDLVLIPTRLAGATRAGGSPRETQATRAGGWPAVVIPGAACPISPPAG